LASFPALGLVEMLTVIPDQPRKLAVGKNIAHTTFIIGWLFVTGESNVRGVNRAFCISVNDLPTFTLDDHALKPVDVHHTTIRIPPPHSFPAFWLIQMIPIVSNHVAQLTIGHNVPNTALVEFLILVACEFDIARIDSFFSPLVDHLPALAANYDSPEFGDVCYAATSFPLANRFPTFRFVHVPSVVADHITQLTIGQDVPNPCLVQRVGCIRNQQQKDYGNKAS
jgi:hypothetical protein